MEDLNGICSVCGSKAYRQTDYSENRVFVGCPVCGRYQLSIENFYNKINYNHLFPYLVHNRYEYNDVEYRYHTTLSKELCDQYKAEFDKGTDSHGYPIHMDAEIIETWYPKSFAERIDYILLYIEAHTPHVGQAISWSFPEILGALFVDRYDIDNSYPLANQPSRTLRNANDCEAEVLYMLQYLAQKAYIKFAENSDGESISLTLMPAGYSRVDELQKNSSYGRSAFVAMQFGDDTRNLREAIREGIRKAEYEAIFIDEVQHNNFITPELLKYIRDSKFVVVDLTHQNNGAYFEEGYAMGLGKPVIQLCKQETKLHFDIAQKNTIMWEKEDDISDRLCDRINATIDH